jgi:hypothetical protein
MTSRRKQILWTTLAFVIILAACQRPSEHATGTAAAPAPEAQTEPVFKEGYPTDQAATQLKDELLYQQGVQSYLWAMPVLNMYAMKEASEAKFGKGYNVLPIFKERLNAKTLITTPNSDVIYALGYLDLKQDGPLVIEAPPGLQGILDDFFQRPICSVGNIDGRQWCGDVGLPGPDKGKGGKYLMLPPDFQGKVPQGLIPYKSRTYGVFVFWRGFFQDPKQLEGPVKTMEQTRIYPLGKQASAKAMQFPDASNTPLNMLMPVDSSAFDMLKRFIDNDYVDPADLDMRGMLAAVGIVKDQPFSPDTHTRDVLSRAARRATDIGRYISYVGIPTYPGGKYYKDRQYVNGFPPIPGTPTFTAATYTDINLRSAFFTTAYSTSPAMALSIPNLGAKYPAAFKDADGNWLSGDHSYRMHLPAGIPAKLFWSVTLYNADNASGLDNGQPFPSINQMDKPAANEDGSTDLYFGPKSPGAGKNWIATVPGKGFFVILRLYGPTQPFFDQSWKPDDIVKTQ